MAPVLIKPLFEAQEIARASSKIGSDDDSVIATLFGVPVGTQFGTAMGIDNAFLRIATDIVTDPITIGGAFLSFVAPPAGAAVVAARQASKALQIGMKAASTGSKLSAGRKLNQMVKLGELSAKAISRPDLIEKVRAAAATGDANQMLAVIKELNAAVPSQTVVQSLAEQARTGQRVLLQAKVPFTEIRKTLVVGQPVFEGLTTIGQALRLPSSVRAASPLRGIAKMTPDGFKQASREAADILGLESSFISTLDPAAESAIRAAAEFKAKYGVNPKDFWKVAQEARAYAELRDAAPAGAKETIKFFRSKFVEDFGVSPNRFNNLNLREVRSEAVKIRNQLRKLPEFLTPESEKAIAELKSEFLTKFGIGLDEFVSADHAFSTANEMMRELRFFDRTFKTGSEIRDIFMKQTGVSFAQLGRLRGGREISLKEAVDKARIGRKASVSALLAAAPKKEIGLIARGVFSVESQLRNLGAPGNKLADLMHLTRDEGELRAGLFISAMKTNLKGLSKAEKNNFVDVLEGVAKPLNEKVATAAAAERGRLTQVFDLSSRVLPEERVAFRENYFPHIFDKDEIEKLLLKDGNTSTRDKAIKKLVDSGQFNQFADEGVRKLKAEEFLDRVINKNRERIFGNLESQRLSGVDGWIRDPERALSIYYSRAHRRIAEAANFGPKDEIALGLIADIADHGGDHHFATRNFERFVGKNQLRDEQVKKWLDRINGFEIISKLGLAQILNATQGLVNTAMETNVRTAVKAFQQAFTKEGVQFGERAGATLDSTLREISRISGHEGGRLSEKFLTYTGFAFTEQKNRIIAAVGGKMRAQWALDVLQKGGNKAAVSRARDTMQRLGLDADAVLKRGSLSEDELLRAGLRMSNITQFRSDVLELPEFFKSDWGRLFTQFKSFAFNHARFVKNVVKRDLVDLKNGDPSAIPRLLIKTGFAAAVGEIPADIRFFLGGRDRAEGADRFVENISTIGGIGIFSDIGRSLAFGEKGVYGFITGPAISDAVRLIGIPAQKAINKGVAEGGTEAALQAVRTIPAFGPQMSRFLRTGSFSADVSEEVASKSLELLDPILLSKRGVLRRPSQPVPVFPNPTPVPVR